MNPLTSHYARCNTGDPADKYANLPEFPHMLDIELTSSCNFRCLMCPTGNLSLKRKPEFMKWGMIDKIVSQCADHGSALRFIGWGEPLLHPDVASAIMLATKAGLATHLNTNGSKLDRFKAVRLIVAGLTSLKFSFQGVTRTTYQDMRNTNWFEQLIETIVTFREVRGDKALPWIAVSTTITDETPIMVKQFRRRLEPLVDELSIGNTIFDFMDMAATRLKPEERARLEKLSGLESGEKRHPVPCPEVYDKLSIHADGSVVLCCNDFNGVVTLGNVNQTPIIELWRHPKIEAYRERLAAKNYDAPLCKDCYDYMGVTG